MRWAENVACIGDEKYIQNFWSGNVKERDYLED